MKWGVISTAKIGTEKVIPAMQESDKLEILAIAGRVPKMCIPEHICLHVAEHLYLYDRD